MRWYDVWLRQSRVPSDAYVANYGRLKLYPSGTTFQPLMLLALRSLGHKTISAVIGPRDQGLGEGRQLNEHFHGRCERRRDVRVAGASLGGYRHGSPSRGKVLVMPAKPLKSQMPVWQM